MKTDLLKKHIQSYIKHLSENSEITQSDRKERKERIAFYQSWAAERISTMTPEDVLQYLSRLWAMLIWGNKQYAVNKILSTNGLEKFRQELSALVWGKDSVAKRWDCFRENIKSVGPAMMSEILCYTNPNACMLWNRRAYVSLNYLGVPDLPRYDYQLTGARYEKLCAVCQNIAEEIGKAGVKDVNLLWVDYFIWSELQVVDKLTDIGKPPSLPLDTPPIEIEKDKKNFVHNEIRDKISDIGQWLGLQSDTEIKVADGAVVDTVWEATISNMGRVIYVFEVQTSGSIDSLLMNLLKALNNPAVQGVVAVSDADQLEIIKKEAHGIKGLSDKLKCWNYEEVMKVHDLSDNQRDGIEDKIETIKTALLNSQVARATGGATFENKATKQLRQTVSKSIEVAFDALADMKHGHELVKHLRQDVRKGNKLYYPPGLSWQT